MVKQHEIVLASRNFHKVTELNLLLAPHRLVALPDEVELPAEDGDSFEQNALIKARAAARATGSSTLADDSGIVVAVLGGEPGVRSARYAGEHAGDRQNLAKLLDEMKGRLDRRAAYVCVLAFVDDSGGELVAEGRCEGTLTDSPRGGGGFGYDPIFVPAQYAEQDLTMAQISQAEKDAISHRGAAAAKMLELLSGRP